MIQYRHIPTNGIRLHVAESGTPGDPVVLLLHGFPEFWYGWRNQIPCLVEQGFHVVVPDQRGHNLSDKPLGLAAYNLDILAKDIVGLINHLGQSQVYLAAHDWGAVVAWWLACKYPEYLKKLVIMNVPHPVVMEQHLRNNREQLKKSWYIFAFQLPWLPEKILGGKDFEYFAQSLNGSAKRGCFLPSDLEKYKAAWRQPGAITAMLNWYRAALRSKPKERPNPQVKVPTLMIWGTRDKYLGQELAQPSIALCEQGRLVFIEEAGHFVQHEEPEEVNQLMVDFFTEDR